MGGELCSTADENADLIRSCAHRPHEIPQFLLEFYKYAVLGCAHGLPRLHRDSLSTEIGAHRHGLFDYGHIARHLGAEILVDIENHHNFAWRELRDREELIVHRMVNNFEQEALSAVMPAVALQQLWKFVGVVEKALLTVSGFVVLVGFAGMLVALVTSLNERRREMAVLRSVGARPGHIPPRQG